MIHKITNTESENGELKCKIQHLKHASTLEKELLKNKLEAKCEQLTEQNKTQTDKINKLVILILRKLTMSCMTEKTK